MHPVRAAAATAAALVLVAGGLAHADTLQLGDGTNSTSGATFGPAGGSASFDVQLKASNGGNGVCQTEALGPVTVTFTSDQPWATKPADVHLEDCASKVTVFVALAPDAPANGMAKVSGVASADADTVVTAGDVSSQIFAHENSATDFMTVHVRDGDPSTSNQAPTIATDAQNVTVVEGGADLANHGAFADDAGVGDLTITHSGAGDFTVNADGTWSWARTGSVDDASGSVSVTATDAGGLSVTDSFDWSVTNAAPVITVAPTVTMDCVVNVGATFTDAGVLDSHSYSISWGDATTTASPPGVNVPTGVAINASHAFSGTGPYSGSITVYDNSTDTVTNHTSADLFTGLVPDLRSKAVGGFMPPLYANGSRSSFKTGSTIPLKIMVVGCDGKSFPGNAGIKVNVVATAPTTGPVTLQSGSTQSPTLGLNMRPATDKYMYNFSTKRSQLSGTALTAGWYAVSVTSGAANSPTSVKNLPAPVNIQLVR